jgi:hypothetical protein
MGPLYSIVGTPSPTLYATMNILRTLVQVSVGSHLAIVANTVDVLQKELLASGADPDKPTILFSDYPNAEMVETYYLGDGPVTICLDDFTTVAHYAAVARALVGVVAARFAMMGHVNLEPLIVSLPTRSLVVRDQSVSLQALVGALAALYGFSDNGALGTKVLAYLALADRPAITLREYIANTLAAFDGARDKLERRSPLENELIDFLAPHYDEIFRGRPLQELHWPPYALLRPEFPDRLTVGPIDLTGPARTFYFGPYFSLPAGSWRAEISFEVQDCFSDNEITLDAFAETVLAIVKAKLPPQGVYGCELRFAIRDPSKPVEIRLKLLTGAIEGLFALRTIRLVRIAKPDNLANAERSQPPDSAPR